MSSDRLYIVTKGQRFGDLTVIDQVPLFKGPSKVLCKCTCGREQEFTVKSLLEGTTTHCGCKGRKHQSHGKSGTPLYKIWLEMRRKDKLKRPTSQIPLWYQWKDDFLAFEKWAEFSGYREGFGLRRIDTMRGHTPDNCYWYQADRGGHFEVFVGPNDIVCHWWIHTGTRKYAYKHALLPVQIEQAKQNGIDLILHTRDYLREYTLNAIESEVDRRGLFH